MSPLILYDDRAARAFEPFALTRPAGELRAGAELLRRRWERALGEQAAGFVGAPHLADFEELDAPPAATGVLPAGAIVANARAAVALDRAPVDADVWTCAGRVAAVRLRAPLAVERLTDGSLALDDIADGVRAELRGLWIDEVWDLVRHLDALLREDVVALGASLERAQHGATVLGANDVIVEAGATIEPFVVIDASAGPVLIRRGATVHAFTRMAGPFYVGEGSQVMGGSVSGCSIGEVCRVRGEMSASVMLGHANKGHDGFVGQSYMGRWSNFGAGTTTSNLKNTYGTVALWTPSGVRDTGMQFLGTLVGDHAKTGIGLRLTTGCVLGAGANVFDAMPPKYVPPFSWGNGEPYDAFDARKFVDVAERVMKRRNVTLTDRARAHLRAAYDAARAPRGG